MFEEYRVVIRYQDGQSVSGYGPLVEPGRRTIRYAKTPNHMPLTATASLNNASVVLLMCTGGACSELRSLPGGRAVRVRLSSGECVTGLTRPVPLHGGTWIRPESAADDRMLVFVPEDAAAGLEYQDENGRFPPQTGRELDFLGAMRQTERMHEFYTASNPDGTSPNERAMKSDPHEHATLQDMNGISPAKIKAMLAAEQTLDESDASDRSDAPDDAPTTQMPRISRDMLRKELEAAPDTERARGVIIRRKS